MISLEEVAAVLSAPDNLKHRCMLSLVCSGGLRAGKLLNLKVTDINWVRKAAVDSEGQGKERQDEWIFRFKVVLRHFR